jgi:hypothetical protein
MTLRAPSRDNVTRIICDCGQRATIKRNSVKICQGCADKDSESVPLVAGTKSYWGETVEREYTVTLGGQP